MSSNHETRGPRRAGLALAIVLPLLASPALAEEPRLATASGDVEIGRGDPPVWRAAGPDEPLLPGDRVRTGRDGRAELAWDGTTIRLYGDSLLRLPGEAPEPTRGVGMERGTGLFDVLQRLGGEAFEVRTPDVVVSVKGTRFAVELAGGSSAVAVYRGSVGVRALALERELLVREGFRAVGAADRPAEIFVLDAADPWDAWGPGARPPRLARDARAASPPAKQALAEAEQAARSTFRREVLKRAVQRDPELARRLSRARVEGQEAPDDPLRESGDAVARDATLATVDPVLDANLEATERTLDSEFIEAWINGEVTSSTGGANTQLDVSVLSGSGVSGGDRVRIDESLGGQFWELTKDDLDGVLEGKQTLPTSLQTALGASDVTDETTFVNLLVRLLDD